MHKPDEPKMIPRLFTAEYVREYTIRVVFMDGAAGEIDLENELGGEIFTPLRDIEFFRQFRLDPELHTIIWRNGADFAPEFLYERIQVPVK
jgi:hypothetical protein